MKDIDHFLSIMNGPAVKAAMEAGEVADLTTDTRSMMRGAVRQSGSEDLGAGGGGDDFDTNGLDTTPSDNPMSDDPGNPEDDPMMGDDMGMGDDGMGGGDPMGGGMDDGMGDMGGGSDMISGADGAGEMSPKHAYLITNLQANAMALYNSVSTLLNTLNEYTVPATTPETRKIYGQVLEHLTEAKKQLEDMLGSEFKLNTYASKMRKYVLIRHLYSVTIEQLSIHFRILDIENDREEVPEDSGKDKKKPSKS